jgi:hypothetical protein
MGRLVSLCIVLSVIYVDTSQAETRIEVAPSFSQITFVRTVILKAHDYIPVELPPNVSNDSYSVAVTFQSGAVRVIALDALQLATPGQNVRRGMDRTVTASSVIDFPAVPQPQGWVATFQNITSTSLQISILVRMSGVRGADYTYSYRSLIANMIGDLDRSWVLPNFNVVVRPCGSANAYSNPNIVICTELVADLLRQDAGDAFRFVFTHEMAHTLLALWGLPGYDNEDVADDFAATLCGKFPAEIWAALRWLSTNDSIDEAVQQLINGDRHTVSIQRARNIQAVLANRDDALMRWNRLLAPFRRH